MADPKVFFSPNLSIEPALEDCKENLKLSKCTESYRTGENNDWTY